MTMNMLRKGQMQGVEKGNITGQVTFIARLLEELLKGNMNGDLMLIAVLDAFLQHNRTPGYLEKESRERCDEIVIVSCWWTS